MLEIILASHGDFAKGILQSAQMIFGQQDHISAVSLQPHEGPDDIRQRLEDRISSFPIDAQILFLVDLWGGTPFHQASYFVKDHEETRVLVTGLNISMLLEALALRMQDQSVQSIAKSIRLTGQDGIRIYPVIEEKTLKSSSILPEGTVLGNGKIQYVLARVDTRLLHGQVATSWAKEANPTRILVVSDSVSQDALRKSLIEQAAPPGVRANVISLSKMIEVSKDPRFGATRALLLFETVQDACKAIQSGLEISTLNIGSIAHKEGKVVVNSAISMDEDDVMTIEAILKQGVQIDVRKVPSDSCENIEVLCKKARQALQME